MSNRTVLETFAQDPEFNQMLYDKTISVCLKHLNAGNHKFTKEDHPRIH